MVGTADLQCTIVWIGYDFATRTGTLVMAPNDCCDVENCIPFFQRIDEQVQRIKIYTGDQPHRFFTMDSGKWISTLGARAYGGEAPATLRCRNAKGGPGVRARAGET